MQYQEPEEREIHYQTGLIDVLKEKIKDRVKYSVLKFKHIHIPRPKFKINKDGL